MDTKNKRNLTTAWIVKIWVNQHSIRIEDSYLYKLSTSNRIYLSKISYRSNYMPVSKVYKHADTL